MPNGEYISVDKMKEALGYEEQTDMCENCSFLNHFGKCTFNPTFPWSPNFNGICDNYNRENKKEEE